jgi:hypothetical protein
MEISPEELSRLLQGGTSGGVAPGLQIGNSSIDSSMMYRAIPQPQNMLQSIAPMIGSLALGMRDPMMIPRPAPGVSPFEAMYAQRVTGPQWQRSQDAIIRNITAGISGDFADIATNAGLHKMFDMSADEFHQTITSAGHATNEGPAASVGRQLTQMALGTSAMQKVMGGDVMGLYSNIFANRHRISGIPGMPAHPMDSQAQEQIRRSSMHFGHRLAQEVWGRPDGSIGMLPNYDVTRGFRGEQLSEVANIMANRGAIQGVGTTTDPEAAVAQVKQMTRTMGVLRDMTGSEDMKTLFNTLDELTQGDWPQIDPGALERSFREMSASAKLLGVTNTAMVEQVTNIQQSMNSMLGITPQARLYGESAGGYAQLPAAQSMTENVLTIAHATGRTSPQDIARIRAQQTGMMAIGMDSKQGRDLQLVEWARQRGRVSEEQYDELMGSIRSGAPKEVQRSIVDDIYAEAFGSAQEGRSLADDPAMMRFVRSTTDATSARNVMENIQAAQQTEFRGRVREQIMGSLTGRTQRVAEGAGTPRALAGTQESETRMQVLKDYFSEAGDDATVDAMQETFDQAVSRYTEQGMTEDEARRSAMGDVNRMLELPTLGGDQGEIRKMLLRQQEEAVTMRSSSREVLGSQESQESAVARATMSTLQQMPGMTDDQMTQIRDMMDIEDVGERQDAMDEFMERELSPAQRAVALEARDYQVSSWERENRSMRADRASIVRQEEGMRMGLTQDVIGEEQVALARALEDVQGGGSVDQATDAIRSLITLSPEEQEEYIRVVSGGPSNELRDLSEFQDRIVQQIGYSEDGPEGFAVARAAGERLGGVGMVQALREQAIGESAFSQIQAQKAGQAAYEAVVGDMGQGARATLPQLAVAFAAGRTDLQGFLGIEEGAPLTEEEALAQIQDKETRSQYKKFLKSKEGRAMRVGVEAVAKGEKEFREALDETSQIARSTDAATQADGKAGLEAMARLQQLAGKDMSPEEMGRAAGKIKYELSQQLGSGQSGAVLDQFDKAMMGIGDIEMGTQLVAQSAEAVEERNPELAERLGLERRISARDRARAKEVSAQQRSEAMTAIAGVGPSQGAEWLMDIDVGDMSRAQKKELRAAMEEAGYSEGSLEARMRSAATELGSSEAVESLDTGRLAGLGKAARLLQTQQEGEEGGATRRAGARGDGRGNLELSGVMVLRNQQGSMMGLIDASGASGTIDGS